jgi:uncharacterized protein
MTQMLEDDVIKVVKEFARENSKKDDIHGFSHVERVYDTCVKMGKDLNAKMRVLKISALLHDVGRIKADNPVELANHAMVSAEMALDFLVDKEFNLSQGDLDGIIHAIKAHSFSNNVIPKTLEAKILSDADKLDALGAIGLYRTIGFTVQNKGGIDNVIEHLENKIMKLKDQMYLDISKEIAEKREQIILEFYDKIKLNLDL